MQEGVLVQWRPNVRIGYIRPLEKGAEYDLLAPGAAFFGIKPELNARYSFTTSPRADGRVVVVAAYAADARHSPF